MLIELFNSMETDADVYYLHLLMDKTNTSELVFMKKMAFKEVQILSCKFDNENEKDEDRVKKHVRHWHNTSKLALE